MTGPSRLLPADGHDVNAPGEHLWNYARLKPWVGWRSWALILLWAPVGAGLCALRVALWPLGMVLYVPAHWLGVGRWYMRLIQPIFGCWVTIRGLENLQRSAAPVVAANHISEFDACAIWAAIPPAEQRLVVNEHSRTVISMAQSLGWPISPIFVNGPSVRDTIRHAVREAAGSPARRRPLLIFPEGRSCSGIAVLRFHDFVFSLGTSVVPCAVRLANPWPVQVQCNGVRWLQNLLVLFFLPCVAYECTFLPPVCGAGLSASAVAEEVRQAISAELGVPCSHLGGKDKVAFAESRGKCLSAGGSGSPSRFAHV
eukprot:CAMPEP_0175287708 /NCGR_PEP_ID=MMETSP0093-20121207/54425_1 /TAXON_ID=311494 /ORGANISM="Alexandrium monilatum, Strain CCMP3105" /LENGTH=312 /DNA_ID=CAMNT_0016583227 /DNA_START=11 /DNA_END=949 /DNA_ORIENTATION=+